MPSLKEDIPGEKKRFEKMNKTKTSDTSKLLNTQAVQMCFKLASSILYFTLTSLPMLLLMHPKAYGTAYVCIGLIETFSVSLLQDGFRRTALRMPTVKAEQKELQWQIWWRSAKCVARLAQYILISFVILSSTILYAKFTLNSGEYIHNGNSYYGCLCFSLFIAALGMIISLLVEDKVVLLLTKDPLSRAKAGMWITNVRKLTQSLCLVIFLWVYPQWHTTHPVRTGIIWYAMGQFISGVSWFVWYWREDKKVMLNTRETPIPINNEGTEHHFPPSSTSPTMCCRIAGKLLGRYSCTEHQALLPVFCFLSLGKLLLNEAERFTLLLLFPTSSWGTFALVSSLGGIISRLVFSPLEDMITVRFSLWDDHCHEEPRISFYTYLMIEVTLGWFVLCFGPLAAASFFSLIMGKHWLAVGAHAIFACYCYYIFLLSLNGALEAFMYSRATPAYIYRLNGILPFISGFGLLVTLLLKYTVQSYRARFYAAPQNPILEDVYNIYILIIGSSVSLLLRICLAARFAVNTWLEREKYCEAKRILRSANVLKRPSSSSAKLFHFFHSCTLCLLPPTLSALFLRLVLLSRRSASQLIWDMILFPKSHSGANPSAYLLSIRSAAIFEFLIVCVMGLISILSTAYLNRKLLQQFIYHLKQD